MDVDVHHTYAHDRVIIMMAHRCRFSLRQHACHVL